MRARREPPDVGKIEVERDEESALVADSFPNDFVRRARESLVMNSIRHMAAIRNDRNVVARQVFIELHEHGQPSSQGQ